MATITIRWSPDTCGCVILEDYDTITDTKSLNSYVTTCSFHSSISDVQTRHGVMRNDNSRKNSVFRLAMANFSAVLAQTDPVSGNLVLKPGIKLNFSFSGTGDTRVLTISFSGVTLTTQQKATLQNLCDTNLGAGKVVIQ